ncbi:MAG TPA: hypothetical protein VG276_06200 [Actinomycetes bacterium]|jgi:hypothetical protein|nr:hypothetical protein [Actinomycetes bacterium]
MDTERDNGEKVLSLFNAVRLDGGSGRFSELLIEIIKGDRWRRYRLPMTEGTFEWATFDEFCKDELRMTFEELKEFCNTQVQLANTQVQLAEEALKEVLAFSE